MPASPALPRCRCRRWFVRSGAWVVVDGTGTTAPEEARYSLSPEAIGSPVEGSGLRPVRAWVPALDGSQSSVDAAAVSSTPDAVCVRWLDDGHTSGPPTGALRVRRLGPELGAAARARQGHRLRPDQAELSVDGGRNVAVADLMNRARKARVFGKVAPMSVRDVLALTADELEAAARSSLPQSPRSGSPSGTTVAASARTRWSACSPTGPTCSSAVPPMPVMTGGRDRAHGRTSRTPAIASSSRPRCTRRSASSPDLRHKFPATQAPSVFRLRVLVLNRCVVGLAARLLRCLP